MLDGEDAVKEFEAAVIRRGYYPFRTDPDELRELSADEPRWHALFEEHMLNTVERWMEMADERLAGTGIRVFVCPGNDDQLEVDAVVANAKTVELGEGHVIDIDGFQLASSGWANRTPWDTYREEDEDVLLERIERMLANVTADPDHTIYSLHCPPHNTGLDEAPQLTADMSLKDAGRATVPVGSTAVRTVIGATSRRSPCTGTSTRRAAHTASAGLCASTREVRTSRGSCSGSSSISTARRRSRTSF